MSNTKQKPNIAVRLPEDLQRYLRAKAIEGHRTLTGEITMRLDRSRELDFQTLSAPNGNSKR